MNHYQEEDKSVNIGAVIFFIYVLISMAVGATWPIWLYFLYN